MRRLLEHFDEIFDLSYRVGNSRLSELLQQKVLSLEAPLFEQWGAEGQREVVTSETGSYVSFHYRPHLFPGMDIKLRLAHELQFSLLPRALPPDAPLSISAVLESYCHLSGDLFGWEKLRDGKFLIWVVDMSGHGVRAGLASAVFRVLIDNLRERSRLGMLVAELNRALHACIRPEHNGLFATAFFMVVDRDGDASYASAAHPSVLLRRADGRMEELAALGRPIGLFAGDRSYETRPVALKPGDLMLLYTDGLVETRGRDGEPFGAERLRAILGSGRGEPSEITAAIYGEAARRQDIDFLEDDVTFLVARFEGS